MRNQHLIQTAAVIAGVMAVGVASANATATMTLDDGVSPVVSISDNGAGDASGVSGLIAYIGSMGVWTLTVDVGTSKPNIGSATAPMMDLHISALSSSGPGSLTITFSDDGFGPMSLDGASPKLEIGGAFVGGVGSYNYSATVNGFTTTMAPQTGSVFSSTTYGSATGLSSPGFTVSQTVVINHAGAGNSSADATLVVPEPATYLAGAVLIIPFTASTLRFMRKNRAM